MYCQYCGAELAPSAKFCPACGAAHVAQLSGPLAATSRPLFEQNPSRVEKQLASRALLLGIGALAIAGFMLYRYYLSRPAYSLAQAAIALQKHDRLAFEKYVDVNAILVSGVDTLMSAKLSEAVESTSDNSLEQLGALVGENIATAMKPQVVSILRGWVNELVEKGSASFDGETLRMADLHDLQLKSAPQIRTEGGLADVRLILTRQNSSFTIPIEFEMTKKEGYWQITNVRNWPELAARFQELNPEQASGRKHPPMKSRSLAAESPAIAPPVSGDLSQADTTASAIAAPDQANTSDPAPATSEPSKYGTDYDACMARANTVEGVLPFDRAVASCAAEETTLQDARLTLSWKQLLTMLSGQASTTARQSLIREERTWIKFKEKNCAPVDDGVGTQMDAQICLLDATYERANQLEAKLRNLRSGR